MGKIKFVTLLVSAILGASSLTQASTATSQEAFCSLDRKAFIAEFEQVSNRLGFENPAGKLDMGVCWWDSMFQRSSIYLTVFRPDLDKPTAEQASKLISEIIKKQKVVEIPGYANMMSFSIDYENEITRQLSDWQLKDAFIKQSWVLDLWLGGDTAKANTLSKKMDRIYNEFSENQVVPFVRLKLGYIVSHALLIIDIAPLVGARGYQMQVIDSNLSSLTETVVYHYGDRSLALPEDDISEFIPTEGQDSDFNNISRAIGTYCGSSGAF